MTLRPRCSTRLLLTLVTCLGSCAIHEPLPLPKGLQGLDAAVEEEPAARGWIGLEVEANESDSLEDLEIRPGVRLVRVAEGSPAERSGMRVGDVLLTFDDTPVDDPDRLESLLRGVRQPRAAQLRFERGTRVLETEVEIDVREALGGARPLYHVERGLVRAAFRNGTGDGAYPVIARLAADSPLLGAGAREGDQVVSFLGADPGSAGEFVRRLRLELQPGEEAHIRVVRDGGEAMRIDFRAWEPEREMVANRFWPLWAWEYVRDEDREVFVIGDLFLFSLFKKKRLGQEREYSILSLISWRTGEAVLESSMHPDFEEGATP